MTDDFQFDITDEASGLGAALSVAMREKSTIKAFSTSSDVLSLYWLYDPHDATSEFPAPMDVEMTKAMILAWLSANRATHDNDPDVMYATGFRMTGNGWGRKVCSITPVSVEYHK